MKIKNIISAFTIVEGIIVVSIVAVIVILTATTTLKADVTKQKKLTEVTKLFYNNLNNAYKEILIYNTSDGSIKTIKNKNESSHIDSSDLRNLFTNNLNGEAIDCNAFGINLEGDTLAAEYLEEAECASFNPQIVAGFLYDSSCSTEIEVKEFFESTNRTTRHVGRNCGYIIYGFRGTSGIIGYDLFTVPLGKAGLK